MLTAQYIRTQTLQRESSQGLDLTIEEDLPVEALYCNYVYQMASEKSWESTWGVERGAPHAHRPVHQTANAREGIASGTGSGLRFLKGRKGKSGCLKGQDFYLVSCPQCGSTQILGRAPNHPAGYK